MGGGGGWCGWKVVCGGVWWSWCARPIIEELVPELPPPATFPALPAPPIFPSLVAPPMVIDLEPESTSEFEEEQEALPSSESECEQEAAEEEFIDAPELLDGIRTPPKAPPSLMRSKPKALFRQPTVTTSPSKPEEKKAPKPLRRPQPPPTPPPGHPRKWPAQ